MQLNHDQLQHLLALLGESDIQELKLEGDDFRLEVRRNLPSAAPTTVFQASAAPAQVLQAAPPLPVAPSAPPPPAAASRSDLLEVTAPMVATFYRAAAPGEAPFVEVGARIKVGQTVCILEAMKLMNEIEAEADGKVIKVLVESTTPVEFGQPLFLIDPL